LKKPAIQSIFIDFGNVCATFDFERFLKNFSEHTLTPESRLEEALFDGKNYSNLFAKFERGEISPAQFFHSLTEFLDCRARIDFETFADFWVDVFIAENTELNALLDLFPQKKYLLSNTNTLAYGRYIAESAIVRKHFRTEDERILSCRVGAIKPDIGIYHHAIARSGTLACETIFVDDVAENISAW